MVAEVLQQEEISTPEEFAAYIKTRGFKPEYAYKLMSMEQWQQAAEEIMLRDSVNRYEAFKRWAQSLPVRM